MSTGRAIDGARRVVVTGIGLATPLGLDETSVWERVIAGKTGIGPLTAFDLDGYISPYKVGIAAQVDDEAVQRGLAALGRRPYDRMLDLAMVAAADALRQARLIDGEPPFEPREVPVIVGTGAASAQSVFEAAQRFAMKGPKGLLPSSVPRIMGNSLSANLSMQFKLIGANYTVISACTSAANAIGDSYRRILHGETDMALTGGSEGGLDPFYFGIWNNLGVLSPNPDPKVACRPFDAERQGTVLGEGAGILVLESLESAERRGATVRAEIIGYGESSDAGHITGPSAEGQARAIRAALTVAGLDASEVGYVNAHGTATKTNDPTESTAIRNALGDAADDLYVGSNKSYFGHTLGASGAIEAAVTIMALEHGLVPPNFNLESPDPECNVRLAGRTAVELERPVALKNSFGFGGGNAVLALTGAGKSP